MDTPSLVEIAAKQRHVMLLKKVRNNQPLTTGELKELKEYEISMARKATTKKSKAKPPIRPAQISKSRGAKNKKKSIRSSRQATVDWIALCGAAAMAIPEGADPAEVLAGRLETPAAELKKLAAADPGRLAMLSRLAGLADSPLPEGQAADRLGMTPPAFTEFLKTDVQAGVIWRHTRTDSQLRAFRDLQRQSPESPSAAKQLLEQFARVIASGGADLESVPLRRFSEMIGEKYDRVNYWKNEKGLPFREEGTGTERRIVVDLDAAVPWWGRQILEEQKLDLAHLSVIRAAELLGVSNSMMHEYFKQGMPRNRDKEQTVNYFLARDWYKELLSRREGPAAPAFNPLMDAKAKMKQLEYEKAVGSVVDRVAVELGLGARATREVQLLEQKFRELPGAMAGHTAEEIKDALSGVMREFRELAAQIPEDILDVIPEQRKPKLSVFLMELVTERDGNDQ